MEGEAAAAILQVVVQNLIDHSKKEISLIRGLDRDAAKLAGSLDTIQKFLNDAEMRTIPGDAVKSWLKKLQDVAFDADNVLDELNYHLLSKQIKPIKPVKEKVLSCFSSFSSIARPRNMAIKIQEINENLDFIHKEAAGLGLVERLAADAPTLVNAAFETDSFTAVPIFIGRDDVVSEIIDILSTSITADERVISILPIVGMGGLGKTTLARKIFDDRRIKTEFGLRIWVHVSQTFDPIILFKKILKELSSSDQVEVESRQDILSKLQNALKNKTYFLVLDDVWNQDLSKWEDFFNSLLGVTSFKGAIVVTTRSMEVASIVNPIHIHKLKGLLEEDCWTIIKAKTFEKQDVPSEFEATGRRIARRCQGLPLAANVVGGVLRNKSQEKWLSVEEKWLSDDEGDNIRKILRLSFHNLSPPSLKKCFAYCSIFYKGRTISMKELIEYWMAEGFLQGDGSNEMESVGEKFVNVLLHNSLLHLSGTDIHGNVKYCEMHDVVHDLASSVLGSSNSAHGARYMILRDKSSPIPKHLRILLVIGETSGTDSDDVEDLPSSIRQLIHLRYLHISTTSIKHLPDWIGELYHLQTLDVSYFRKLPSTIKYLINLRHLYVGEYVELPVGIGRLSSLQTLPHFTVGDKNGCKIKELGSLNDLKGKVNIFNLERVCDKEEAEKANLYKKSKILELWLRWGTNREGELNDENVLEGLQPHSHLKMLVIWGFKGKRIPMWTLKMAVRNVLQGPWVELNKMIEIRLIDCEECEEIPMLGHLPNLKYLLLQGLNNLTSINSLFYGLLNKETRTVFPALERLQFLTMPKLAVWAEVELAAGASEVKVFPQLQHLEIRDCQQLMSAPTRCWSYLRYLIICRSSSMLLANIFCVKLASLRMLYLEEIEGLERLPDWLFCNNPNFFLLKIRSCPNLRELPDGLHTLNSFGELIILSCPNLERIADGEGSQSQGSFTSLYHLEIYNCDALLYLPCEMVGSSLKKLLLSNLSSLRNLPSLIDCLPKVPHLTNLTIVGVPKFMATCSVQIWPLRSLRELSIDVSMGGSMETVNGILEGCCHSLYSLSLKGMQIWESLPESIQHLTSLHLLELENFGMEELPEWFWNLSSLNTLCLSDFQKLRRLPLMDALPRLTRLQRFGFDEGCPEFWIVQQSNASNNSEESKTRKGWCLSCI